MNVALLTLIVGAAIPLPGNPSTQPLTQLPIPFVIVSGARQHVADGGSYLPEGVPLSPLQIAVQHGRDIVGMNVATEVEVFVDRIFGRKTDGRGSAGWSTSLDPPISVGTLAVLGSGRPANQTSVNYDLTFELPVGLFDDAKALGYATGWVFASYQVTDLGGERSRISNVHQVVPEPSGLALGLCAVVAGYYFARRRQR